MMTGGKPGAESPANPAAAQTDQTTTLDHLSVDTSYTISGTLNSGPADGVVQLSLSKADGGIVPVTGGTNNEGHLLRASDGYPQSFSLGFQSPSDVTGFKLRILSATPGWDIDHTITGPPPSSDPPPPPVDESKPTSQGQIPTSVPDVYEAGQTTSTPAVDLQAFRDFEPDPATDVQASAEYEIVWGGLVATALQSHGAGQASAEWANGEVFYWDLIESNASEPLKTVAAENKTFWTAVEVRAVNPNFIPPAPWNSETFLSAVYDWGWYSAVMANRPAGKAIVGIETWHANKLTYTAENWP